MRAYIKRIRAFRPEIKRFLIFSLFVNIGIGVFTLIYNLYLVQLGFQEDFIGAYNGAMTLSMAAMALVMGPLINRVGNYWCLTAGTIAYVVTAVALSLLSNGPAIIAAGLVSGAATALVFVPTMPFVIEWTNPRVRPTVAALTFSLTSLATTAGSLVGGWTPRLYATLAETAITSLPAYRFSLLAGATLSGLGLIPLWLMRESRRGGPVDTDQAPLIGPVAGPKRRIRYDVGVFVLCGLLLSIGAGAVIPFYNVFLETIGATPGQIGLIFSLGGAVAALVGLMAPTIGRKVGPIGSEVLLRLLPVPAYLLLAVVPGLGIALLAQILRSIAINVAWPINSTFMSEVLPPRARANAFSLRSGVWNFGFALASLMAGQVIVTHGYASTFVLFGISSALGALVFALYYAPHARAMRRDVSVVEPATEGSP